jgi:signal transduction histidine kinase
MQTRTIFTDGRGHPADLEPGFFGHSIGHWEGDTLVVDTVGIKTVTELSRGIKHSDKLRVTERIHLAKDNPDSLVVEMTMDQTAVFFRSRKINVEVDCPTELPVVADPSLLRIALNNFLTNAAKYGREGGRATVTVKLEDGRVTMSVWNEGEGFPAEAADHLFEKFFRVRNSSTHSKRGSGIGLFTVKNIAELHGGRAWAESEPGAWAAFHLSFPSDPPAAVQSG